MRRFTASRYASWPPAVTTVAGSSAIVTGVAVVATVALHRRDDGPESDRRRHRQRGSKVFQDSAIPRAGCGCARRVKRDTTMTVVRAAAVQISPALYSREGTFDKVVQKIAELGRRGRQAQIVADTGGPDRPDLHGELHGDRLATQGELMG